MNSRTKRQSNFTRSQLPAWMIITSRRWNSNQLEIVKSMLTYCLEMIRYRTNWQTCILWSVNKLTRSVTKWTRACDRRLARLIAYIHHTNDHRQRCHVGTTAQNCRLGLFQDSPSSGGLLCIFGSRTFVPTSWMCKKQTSVSQSSIESDIISLDAGLRMGGFFAHDLWDVVIEVFHSLNSKASTNQKNSSNEGRAKGAISITWPQTQIRLNVKHSCTFLKTTRQ